MSRKFIRTLKNISSSDAEIKIKNATSNDPFGPTASELNELSILSSSSSKSLKSITTVLGKRINDKNRNWRHILKSLTVIEYLLISGSLEFVYWIQNHKYLVNTLVEFTFDDNKSIEIQIRNKSRSILKLINNEELLLEKRSKFHIYRNKMSKPSNGKRSSLDINRSDLEIDSSELFTPIEFQRGSKSMEILRSASTASASNDDALKRVLHDIDEE